MPDPNSVVHLVDAHSPENYGWYQFKRTQPQTPALSIIDIALDIVTYELSTHIRYATHAERENKRWIKKQRQ